MPPAWLSVLLIALSKPVFVSASSSVLNSPGSRLIIVAAFGGGTMMLSTPWITPLVPNWTQVSAL